MQEIIKYVDPNFAELVRRNGHHDLLVTEKGICGQPEPLVLVHQLDEKTQLEWARYMFVNLPDDPSWWAFEMLEKTTGKDFRLGLAVIVINPAHLVITSADITPRTKNTKLGISPK